MISGVVYRHDMTNKKPDSNEQNTHEGICHFDGHESSAFRIEGVVPGIRKANHWHFYPSPPHAENEGSAFGVMEIRNKTSCGRIDTTSRTCTSIR